MNLLKKAWPYISKVLIFAAGCVAGWAREAWTSPLGPHLCFANGREMTMAFLDKWAYNSFWIFIIGVPSILVIIEFALITIGVWRKKG